MESVRDVGLGLGGPEEQDSSICARRCLTIDFWPRFAIDGLLLGEDNGSGEKRVGVVSTNRDGFATEKLLVEEDDEDSKLVDGRFGVTSTQRDALTTGELRGMGGKDRSVIFDSVGR